MATMCKVCNGRGSGDFGATCSSCMGTGGTASEDTFAGRLNELETRIETLEARAEHNDEVAMGDDS